MSSTFTPSNDFKDGPEKEWPAKLGALDWDDTRIVFTKRSLIEFLKYTGVSVDPNFHTIAKLPRHAVVGKMTDIVGTTSESVTSSTAPENPTPATAKTADFKPSRRVREVPGGPQSFSFGDVADEIFDAPAADANNVSTIVKDAEQPLPKEEEATNRPSGDFRPSRRVRTAPGGPSQLASLWGDETEAEPQFRPSRRVRERPGGVDSIADLL